MIEQTSYVGADGCKAGWISISLTEKTEWTIDAFHDISGLWEKYRGASLILLDVPIGLRDHDTEERKCDLKARKLLRGKRASSVFPAPSRPALSAQSYPEACMMNKQATGRRLSRQTYGILSKIREVDTLLSQNALARERVREIHPEVCFWAMSGHPMRHSKKSKQGFQERKLVLRSACPQANDIINSALGRFQRRDVARDDILDALTAAVTAIGGIEDLVSIPETPELDLKGLRMEMVYRPRHA